MRELPPRDRPASSETADVAAAEPPTAEQPAATDPAAAREQRRQAREARRHQGPKGMVPARERRRFAAERVLMRVVATGGIVGIAVALGAIFVAQDVAGWIVGLAIGVVTVVLAALLWSSREL